MLRVLSLSRLICSKALTFNFRSRSSKSSFTLLCRAVAGRDPPAEGVRAARISASIRFCSTRSSHSRDCSSMSRTFATFLRSTGLLGGQVPRSRESTLMSRVATASRLGGMRQGQSKYFPSFGSRGLSFRGLLAPSTAAQLTGEIVGASAMENPTSSTRLSPRAGGSSRDVSRSAVSIWIAPSTSTPATGDWVGSSRHKPNCGVLATLARLRPLAEILAGVVSTVLRTVPVELAGVV
mmetsp:Transcript_3886/g.10762  ORF Transcript_3886/g.10762 Transcript_3886/m.10762 type:complete len:237 (-) Transcript_3886:321-1031(-)